MENLPIVHVVNGRQKKLLQGHPWVYGNEIERVEGEIEDGGLVTVVDFRGRYMGTGFYNSKSLITVRLLTHRQEEITDELIASRVKAACDYRRFVMNRPGTDSCRLIYGEADRLPGVIADRFGGVIVLQVLALGMESQLRLRREEAERLSLEREKMQSDRLLQSMSRIVDRYSIINLDTDRYRYRELRNSEPLYPASGRYSDMVETISKRYVALTETENAKLSRLITPEYLRSVLRRPDDNLKIEYCSRTENAYMVLTVIPVEWHADGTVYEVMQVVQDIGQKIELENMANTDSMTGLFNERYFSRVLNICEEKKLPFVLYCLDLDRFKPINDTYGHLMGDRLLKEIAARLLRCIRSRDYAFRIGGDEFALIVSADMDEGQRARMAERIQTTLSAPVVLDGKELSVGVSCGCACYPEDGSASQVRIAADSRMYETKQRHHENDRTEGES